MSFDTSHTESVESRPEQGQQVTLRRFRTTTTPPPTPPLDPQPNVLSMIYDLVTSNKTDDAMDLLYDVVDELLSAHSFPICERMLTNIDLDRLNADLLIGVLSITLPAKNALPARAQFLQRVEQRLARTLPPNQIAEFLHGLR